MAAQSRRAFLAGTSAALVLGNNGDMGAGESTPEQPGMLLDAAIPSSGERVPRLGLGTWQTFDIAPTGAERAALAAVLREFVAAGGRMVDTSPMYGRAESVLGDLLPSERLRERVFLATKVWTSGRDAGRESMRTSMRRLRSQRVELMQVHNLLDWRIHLATIREMQQAGTVRYAGITHYQSGAIRELSAIVRAERVDFVQHALSLDEPDAAAGLLALCADRGVAFIANRPFGGGGAFARTRGRALPEWVGEFGITSWAQFLLKWVLAHPEVTCAIPATSDVRHLHDNMQAGRGRLPDSTTRARMLQLWRSM